MAELTQMEFDRTKDPFQNNIPIERLFTARDIRDERFQVMSSLRSPVPGISWTERGANNVGGRTRAVLFDLNDAANGYKKVWAAGVGGGLWKTNDITVSSPSWTKVDDLLDNLAVTSIVQSSTDPDLMYFATGEGWFNNDAIQGAGVWKSTDGGNTWNRLMSTSTFYFVQDLIIDRNEHLYASVRHNNQLTGATGVYKSMDGGATWAAVLNGSNASNNRGADLELAANGDIYATMGTNFSNGNLYRSSYATHGANTGNNGTFANITPNTSGAIVPVANTYHRIEIACAPSDGNVLYALFQGWNTQDCISIQQYDAATNTWTIRSVPTIVDQGDNSVFTRGQGWYNLIASVDPNNANRLYIGGIDALRSDDNGQNWTQMTTWSLFNATGFTANQYVHADHHAIVYAPGSSSRAIIGTDGGLYYTTNANITGAGNKPTFGARNSGYNVTQYYSVAAHPTNSNYYLAGAQDNGSHRFNAAGLNNVTEVSGGDGGYCHIDQDNPLVQITSYVYNNYYVSTNGGTSFTSRSLNNRGDFINASDYDNTANILYAGDDVGFFFRWTNPQDNATDVEEKVAVAEFTGRVSHVAVAPITANRVFFGLRDGKVVMVDNANTGTTLNGTVIYTGVGNVSSIAVDPANENHIVVTYSNYGVQNVWETQNALAATPTWTSVEGDLPDMPVRWAMFDPRNSDWLILATELGIWSTNDLDGAGTLWSPTNNGFANTRVDMLQYRSSDRTIVAATHGRGLFTAVVPSVTTADINFSSATNTATEGISSTDECRGYKDYSVQMTIANAPTGTATITLSLANGNTATEGEDFVYTTNGSFTSPSKQLQFLNGSTDSKTINIRVYDDAEVETNESFTIQYQLSGTTNAQPGIGAQTHTFNLSDNDAAPVAFSSTVNTIGTEVTYMGDNNNNYPFNSRVAALKTQIIYKASELLAAGFTAGNISSIGFNMVKQSTRPYNNFQVKLGVTSIEYLVDGVATQVPVTTVKSIASYNTVNGWNQFILDQSFIWNGTDNLVVEICYDNSTADATQQQDLTLGYTDGGTASQGAIMWGVNTTCAQNFTSVGYFGQGYKPQLRIGKETPGTEVSASVITLDTYFGPLAEIFVYDNSGRILAKLKNLSSHNYGCTQVQINRAGNGASNFWNNNAANMIMNKTFRIIPANNNASGSYEMILYYTPAEVTGWETATGQSFANIQLIKAAGNIADVTLATPTAAGAISLVTPVIGTLGTNHTISHTFTNGFSGFGAGIPGSALPVVLVDFTGKIQGNGVQLNWQTSSENNSRGFEVERSYDGTSFTKIGFVSSKGNSVTGHRYEYFDATFRQENAYYRLKQIDIDGKSSLSRVVLVRDQLIVNQGMKLLKNPVRDVIDLQFETGLQGSQVIRVTDASGKVLFNTIHKGNGETRLRLPVMNSYRTKGVYVVSVGRFNARFIVE